MTSPIAVLCSDLHFSHRPPVARSAEPDWYAAMERQWNQVREVAEKEQIPVVIAGDLFDNWKSPPELVNFVIRLFRGLSIYAIPGQHDLPNHVYEDMHRSSYGTLIEAGVMEDVSDRIVETEVGLFLRVVGFPWGREIKALKMGEDFPKDSCLLVSVCHRYIWTTEKTCYPGAPAEQNLAVLKKQLEGYDAAVFGDNHKGFLTQSGKCNVLNCGGFMPRKSDERTYKPRVGLLTDDGEIDQVFLDISKDKWIDPEDEAELICRQFDLSGLVGDFENLGADALDFADALVRMMDKNGTDESVRQKVVAALQKGREDEEK